jgi:hypothetical protein
MEKRNKRVIVFSDSRYGFKGDWPSDQAYECIAWFAAKVAEIPEEYRESGEIELNSVNGYEGEHYPAIKISYTRPETDEELAKRRQVEQQEAELRTKREKQVLVELKAKYEK